MSRRKLSKDDQQVWEKVKESITPLEGRPAAPEIAKRHYFEKSIEDQPLPSEWLIGKPSTPNPRLDKNIRRQIRTQKRMIEKTLDLHGMNQDNAYGALKTALENAAKREMKTLIIVTGKGGKRWTQSEASNIAYRKRADFDQYGGVLKRMVPLWLSSPDLAPFVHSYSEAGKEHGGAGALYVILRRKPSALTRGV